MKRITGILLIVLSAASFGTLAIFGRFLYAEGLDTFTLLFLRFSFAALVMALILILHRESFPHGKILLQLIGMGAIGYAGQAFSFLSAIKYASAGLVALLLYLYPMFVFILSVIVLHEKATGIKITAIILALIGTALLRFPIDPQAQPQGRIAAGATIMCRCNGFIDFDLADFAAYSAKQIQTALGGPLPAGPKPQPVPQPGPSARRRRAPRKQAAPPKLGNPKAVLPGGPTEGPLVSDALAPQGTLRSLHARAAKLIDQVHSDGILDKIPLKASAARRFYGQFKFYAFGRPVEIKMSKAGLAAHPINTLIHEVGHYIDAYAVGRNMPEGSFSWVQQRGAYATHIAGASTPMEGWRTAAKNSPTYQRLRAWRDAKPNERLAGGGGYEGDGTIPKGVVRKHLSYLTSTEETWARSYAQYVVVRSGDPEAMAELRRMQQGASYGPVSANTPFNTKPMGTDPTPNSWDYPVVWQDDEFEPIARAFDAIFEAMGWRKKS